MSFQHIEGWLTEDEGLRLESHASQCRELIVEIGSYRGRSSLYIAKGIEGSTFNPIFYSIDPHAGIGVNGHNFDADDLAACYHNFAAHPEFGQHIRKLVMRSDQAAPLCENRSIDMLFVDGDHSYEGVTDDLCRYLPRMKQGGCVILHDWYLDSVRTATYQFDCLVYGDQVDNMKVCGVNHGQS